jgi:hypothetical protein
MKNKHHFVIPLLIILVVSSAMCFGSDDNDGNEPETPEEWWDLSIFNEFLGQNFDVTYKKEDGSSMVQDINDPSTTLFITVGIDEPFSAFESETLHNFVQDGGNLIIAGDNATNIRSISSKFNVECSDHKIIYIFEQIDYNYTFLPVLAQANNNTYDIIVHSPLGLEPTGGNFRVLARSHAEENRIISALDMNDNIKIDGADKPGPIPIIIEVSVGKGTAVFISDASMFSNNLWKLESLDEDFPGRIYQNDEFIMELIFGKYRLGGEVILDKSKQTEGFSNFHPYPKGE